MEQNNINIAALLEDCPKGTKLYSPICGECKLDKINAFGFSEIVVLDNDSQEWHFNECCQKSKKGECLLFPSKEVRDWNLFQVKYCYGCDGAIQLLIEEGGKNDGKLIGINPKDFYYISKATHKIDSSAKLYEKEKEYILSTGTELKLEEEQPKFKEGDVVKIQAEDITGMIKDIVGNEYKIQTDIDYITTRDIHDIALATPSEIAKWNKETLEPNHLHYSTSKRKIVYWFLPFDECIMRDEGHIWFATLFSYYDKVQDKFSNIAHEAYGQCLPYNEETAKLIGTDDDYEEE